MREHATQNSLSVRGSGINSIESKKMCDKAVGNFLYGSLNGDLIRMFVRVGKLKASSQFRSQHTHLFANCILTLDKCVDDRSSHID